MAGRASCARGLEEEARLLHSSHPHSHGSSSSSDTHTTNTHPILAHHHNIPSPSARCLLRHHKRSPTNKQNYSLHLLFAPPPPRHHQPVTPTTPMYSTMHKLKRFMLVFTLIWTRSHATPKGVSLIRIKGGIVVIVRFRGDHASCIYIPPLARLPPYFCLHRFSRAGPRTLGARGVGGSTIRLCPPPPRRTCRGLNAQCGA